MQLTEKSREKIRLILGIAVSVLLIISGVLFIISCYSIYKSGASPFTRESIACSFSRIAIPVWLTVGAVVLGGAFSVAFPPDEPRLKGKRTDMLVLAALHQARELSCAHELSSEIRREQRLRLVLGRINSVLVTLGVVLPLGYLLNPANFPAVSGEYNSEIANGMLICLAAILPVFVYEVVYAILFDASVKREIELYRSLPKREIAENAEGCGKRGGVLSKIKDFFGKNAKEITLGVRISLLACGIVFVVVGILNGGMADVLKKAIKICTECIGLG